MLHADFEKEKIHISFKKKNTSTLAVAARERVVSPLMGVAFDKGAMRDPD